MMAAMIAVNRVGPKSATAGIRYTNEGMVWAASLMGRRIADMREERAAHVPIATPMTIVIATATSVWASVSMAGSQTWSRTVAHTATATAIAARRPVMASARPTATAST